jgi:hypothetical protein
MKTCCNGDSGEWHMRSHETAERQGLLASSRAGQKIPALLSGELAS